MNFRFRIPIVLLPLLLITIFSQAQPPEPPAGKVWILNSDMSDEFDADSPGEKWMVYDKANSWNRTAAFDKRVPEAQRVIEGGKENYILAMNPMWYEPEDVFTRRNRTYYFAGGGMATNAMQTYGYFEIRIKPSDFPMGSGVFMNSREYTDGPCGVKYKTELDIIENMGYTGPGAGSFNNSMHVNTHVKPTDENCNGLPYLSTGGGLGKPLDEPLEFNVVGAWWKNKDSVDYYLNGEYFQTIEFIKDFYIPMPVILTMETYSWGSDENNATNPKPEEYMFRDDFRPREKRAVYYDWVRSWKLVDIDTEKYNSDKDNVGFYNAPPKLDGIRIPEFTILYSATGFREIRVSVYDESARLIGKDTIWVEAGIGSVNSSILIDQSLYDAGPCQVVCEIYPAGGDPTSTIASEKVALP
ncbi:hypothetical protein ACFLSP_03850 [Bacteroidota bacterium]